MTSTTPEFTAMVDFILLTVNEQLGLSIPVDELMFLDGNKSLDELGADELDKVELVMTLEEHWKIEIPDEVAEDIVTINDLIGVVNAIIKGGSEAAFDVDLSKHRDDKAKELEGLKGAYRDLEREARERYLRSLEDGEVEGVVDRDYTGKMFAKKKVRVPEGFKETLPDDFFSKPLSKEDLEEAIETLSKATVRSSLEKGWFAEALEQQTTEGEEQVSAAETLPEEPIQGEVLFKYLTPRTDVPEALASFIPTVDETYHFQNITEEVCYDIHKNRPVICIGHTGTGKTSMFQQVAARIKQPTIRANMNGQTSISDFVGFWGVKGAETYWVDGVLPFAMKNGLWLIIDEMDFAEAPILSVLNSVLERNGKLVLKEKGNEVIIPHPNFRILATANAVGQMAEFRGLYQGTNIMNEAFLDRFKCYIINYMPAALEERVLKASFPEMSDRLIKQLVTLANTIRSAFTKETVQCTFSTRRLIDWAEGIWHFKELGAKAPLRAAESTIFSKISKEDTETIKGYMTRLLGIATIEQADEVAPKPETFADKALKSEKVTMPSFKMSFKDS